MTTRKPPRRLSTWPKSPDYDKAACLAVDKVYCDGVLVPACVFYDMDRRQARGKDAKGNWLPMVTGEITVTMKENARW